MPLLPPLKDLAPQRLQRLTTTSNFKNNAMKSFPKIANQESERLKFRELNQADAPQLFEIYSDAEALSIGFLNEKDVKIP